MSQLGRSNSVNSSIPHPYDEEYATVSRGDDTALDDYRNSRPVSNPHLDILEYNFTIQCGTDLVVPLYLLDGADKPMNLRGYSAKCKIRKDYDANPLDVLTTQNKRISIDVSKSTVNLLFPKSVTEKYKVEKVNKSYISDMGNTYIYDVFTTSAGGESKCILKGRIKLVPQVSK